MAESDAAVENQWDQVDDFKWLKAGPSPNWTTLSEAERLGDEAWTKVVQGETASGIEEMIRKMGVPRQKRRSSSLGSGS